MGEYLQSLFYYLEHCIKSKKQIEKMVRCVLVLVKYHHQQLISSQDFKMQLKRLKEISKKELTDYRNKIGYNLQAMHYLKDVINNKSKYVMDADRWRRQEIDDSQLTKTWMEKGDSDSDDSNQDDDMIDVDWGC